MNINENYLTLFFETAEMLCVRGLDTKKDTVKNQTFNQSSTSFSLSHTVKEEPPEDITDLDGDEIRLEYEPVREAEKDINLFNKSIIKLNSIRSEEGNFSSANAENGRF